MVLLSWLIYVPLQIACLPLAILGGALTAYKQMAVSKRLGISQTAIEIIQGRWTMHLFSIRPDETTAKLMWVLPNSSPIGLWLCLFPLWIKAQVAGSPAIYPRIVEPGSENMADMVIARTLYFDSVIARVIPQVEQFVLLGAGYDTRAYSVFNAPGIKLFEVDQASVQEQKLAGLKRAGIAHDHVSFVAVDFSSEKMSGKLIEAGYDPAKKTLFLWEGVTLYLSEQQVCAAIVDVKSHAAGGSVLLADIYSTAFLAKIGLGKAAEKALEATNESLDFGLDFTSGHEDKLTAFAQSQELVLGETFFMGSVSKTGPYMVVAEMLID